MDLGRGLSAEQFLGLVAQDVAAGRRHILALHGQIELRDEVRRGLRQDTISRFALAYGLIGALAFDDVADRSDEAGHAAILVGNGLHRGLDPNPVSVLVAQPIDVGRPGQGSGREIIEFLLQLRFVVRMDHVEGMGADDLVRTIPQEVVGGR